MNWLARLKKIDTAPTAEATEPTKPGFVGFVAPGMAPVQKTGGDSPAANDPAAVTHDPDRWSWPHSQAMTGREIDTFTARLARFTDKGLGLEVAEALADKLVTRDREADDRRLCLECTHLAGHERWCCNLWQQAALGAPRISAGLVRILQRCASFKDQNPPRSTLSISP